MPPTCAVQLLGGHSDYLTADLDDIWHPAPLDALAAAEALM